jgi:hypothetical protein
VTPPLEGGHHFSYDLQARWVENGRVVMRTRTVPVYPGDQVTVDFREPPAAEAEGAVPLGPPRKVAP